MPKPPLDDCFAHDPRRMPAGEALALLEERIRPVVGAETVPLALAHRRILAEAVVSVRDNPSFDNVAVDGFAFAHADLDPAGPTRLRLAPGRAAAGRPYAHRLPAGCALQVLTGAPVPEGADTALMQEDVELDGDHVVIPPGVKAGANCRRAGEDIRRDQTVLDPGVRLRPQDVGLAANAGRGALRVYEPLRVALLSTGDELSEPGEPLAAGATYDVNRIILAGLLRGLGCEVTDLGILPDEPGVIEQAIAEAGLSHHAIVASGGASRGDEDHVVRSVQRRGRLHFWQIAVKPGRPLAFGQLGECVFIGLPGNPVAAVVCFLRFARPVLTALAGGRWPEPHVFNVPAGFAMNKKPGRREYLRARLVTGSDGRLHAQRIEREGSGILTSLTDADGLVELSEDCTAVARGDPVEFVSFAELGVVT